ncbi:hypothetical protein [Kineococcus gypseus]|uniref:hypothetical protein n=1 Tax=Kineococcus gypseus TaxID=1637102 RepID=UPI003D7D5A88
MTWPVLLAHWQAIENDLQDRGIDLADGCLDTRSWRWLTVRIAGLLDADTRLARALDP